MRVDADPIEHAAVVVSISEELRRETREAIERASATLREARRIRDELAQARIAADACSGHEKGPLSAGCGGEP